MRAILSRGLSGLTMVAGLVALGLAAGAGLIGPG